MANKLITGVLVLLVLLTAGIGYYSFTLNGQVDRLNERLAAFESEQGVRISAVSDNLAALGSSTRSGFNSLNSGLAGALAGIDAVETDVTAAAARLNSVEGQLSEVVPQVDDLGKRITGAETELSGLSGSIIDASGIYSKAVQATVRITDGQRTIGSGFIYDAAGHVVTANHVVDGLSPIIVMMYDGRVSRAYVVGFCPFSDVAVLNLNDKPSVASLALGDSGKVRIGEPVVAIGSPGDTDTPLGLRDTLTSGIVSGVNRYVDVEGTFISNMLQFDSAVNFGNSGGPVINSEGLAVGVVNARIDPTVGEGIYWAVASNKVKRVADSILARGSFPYPWLGVSLIDITPAFADEHALTTTNGVMINSLVSTGPAQSAGLQNGDIIVSIDSLAVRDAAALTSYIGEFKSPGDTVAIDVQRGANTLRIPVTLGKRS